MRPATASAAAAAAPLIRSTPTLAARAQVLHGAAQQSTRAGLQQQAGAPLRRFSAATTPASAPHYPSGPSAGDPTAAASSSHPAHVEIARARKALHKAREDADWWTGQDESNQSAAERASTGNEAEVGDVPRDGPFPSHPYLGPPVEHGPTATCPNMSWVPSPAGDVIRQLPFPRPLPPVYTHAIYSPPGELNTRNKRLLHVFSIVLCAGLGTYLTLFADWDDPAHGRPHGNHVFSGVQQWARDRMKLLMQGPGVENKETQEQSVKHA